MGNGHLIANGIKLADSKKFSHVCTTLMDKVEQRHGAKLKPMVSNWFFFKSYNLPKETCFINTKYFLFSLHIFGIIGIGYKALKIKIK